MGIVEFVMVCSSSIVPSANLTGIRATHEVYSEEE